MLGCLDKLEDQLGERINIISLLKNYLSQNSIFSRFDCFSIYELISQNKLVLTFYNKKLYYLHTIDKELFIISKNLNVLGSIDVKQVRKFAYPTKKIINMKFFPNKKDVDIYGLNLQSRKNRNFLLKSILEYIWNENSTRETIFRKTLILKLLKQNKLKIYEILIKMKIYLHKKRSYYYYDVHRYVEDVSSVEKLNLGKIFFLFANLSFVLKIFSILFLDTRTIKYDRHFMEDLYYEMLISQKRHKDSILIIKSDRRRNRRRKRESLNSILRDQQEEYGNGSSKDRKGCPPESEGNSDEMVRSRPRGNHQNLYMLDKRSKTNYIKKSNQRMSSGYLSLDKPLFGKILFNITTQCFFGKENKILEVNDSGVFLIYKKGKVILNLCFSMTIS